MLHIGIDPPGFKMRHVHAVKRRWHWMSDLEYNFIIPTTGPDPTPIVLNRMKRLYIIDSQMELIFSFQMVFSSQNQGRGIVAFRILLHCSEPDPFQIFMGADILNNAQLRCGFHVAQKL